MSDDCIKHYVLTGEPCNTCGNGSKHHPHHRPGCPHCSGTGIRANTGPVLLAEAIADLGYVHIESVAAMLEEREKQKEARRYYIILESHPDEPDTRIPCDKCGHTEFKKLVDGSLYCNKCAAPAPKSPEPKPLLKTAIADRNYARRERDLNASRLDQVKKWCDEALRKCTKLRKERNEARYEKNEALTMRDDLQRKLKLSRMDALQKHKALVKLGDEHDALIEERDAALEERRCLNCGSSDYVWYFNNGESAYCSECKRGPAPPPPFKAIPCPSCGRKLMADGVLSGTCCICGTDLALPTCPHCGHDIFRPQSNMNATYKADGTLRCPNLYHFICTECGKSVGTLPLKRTDK